MTSAVVFAYHNVGVRGLLTLLAREVDVRLVVTHRDNPGEAIWFDSVESAARERGLETVFVEDLDVDALRQRVAEAAPDFIFSFYFRHMLPLDLLAIASRGAYNLHGSLLPKYRGRVPINWAVIHGETETGATLHEMTAKPDAGAIVGQTAVPILPDDTAHDVFGKVVVAAEQTLWRVLPDLIDGRPLRMPNDVAAGSYFGGRKPGDGRIDWTKGAKAIHDLVRAVAPPYPGASTTIDGRPIVVEKTRVVEKPAVGRLERETAACLVDGDRCLVRCGDGGLLQIVAASVDGRSWRDAELAAHLGAGAHELGERS